MRVKNWIGKNTWIWAMLGTFVLWMLISVISGGITMKTLLMNATLASFLALLALGQMVVITSGDGAIDLSLSYVVTLAAFLSCRFMAGGGIKIVTGLLITVLVCAAIGFLNGLINIFLKIPAIITTLATGYITYSGILMFSNNASGTATTEVVNFSKIRFGSLSIITVICIAIAVLFLFLMYKTKYGKQIHAIGQSRRAAYLSGIRVNVLVIISFIISSLLGAIVGILLCGYDSGAFLDLGNTYALTSVAATLLGGTIVSGGKCSVVGTIFGAMMLTLVVSFITLTKLSIGIQYIIEGAILIMILTVSTKKEEAE